MTKVVTTCFLSLIHCDSRMRSLSIHIPTIFSYAFSLYIYLPSSRMRSLLCIYLLSSRMRCFSHSLRFSYTFSLYAYTYHLFGCVFSLIHCDFRIRSLSMRIPTIFSKAFSLSFIAIFVYILSMRIPTIFSEAFSLALKRTISSIIIDKLLKGKRDGEDSFQQTGTCKSRSDKIYFRRKETEIRIIFFILIIWLIYLRKKQRVFLSYMNLNRSIEVGEKKWNIFNLIFSLLFMERVIHNVI